MDDFPARILSFNLTLAALSLASAHLLLLQRGPWSLALLILPMGAHILQGVLGLARVGLVMLGQDTGQSLPQVTQPHALLIMLTSLVALSLGFGFVTLHAGRLQRELNDQATTDPLTGLSNRRGFDRALAREWRRYQRLGTPLAVLMLDIDHFKQINDNRGHAGGDLALVRMGEVLRGQFRPYDLIGRLGGEEFCVVLPGTQREEALIAAERLRQADWVYAHGPQGEALRYTLSIGVALADPRDADADALLQRADTAPLPSQTGGSQSSDAERCTGVAGALHVHGSEWPLPHPEPAMKPALARRVCPWICFALLTPAAPIGAVELEFPTRIPTARKTQADKPLGDEVESAGRRRSQVPQTRQRRCRGRNPQGPQQGQMPHSPHLGLRRRGPMSSGSAGPATRASG